MTRIAVIGAGIAGLTLARQLKEMADVEVFEKSRGPGGRVATRYEDPWRFDHGAQFFIARSDAFKAFIEPLKAKGTIKPWLARFTEVNGGNPSIRQWDNDWPHFVGTPGMNTIGRALSEELNLKLNTKVESINRDASGWRLTSTSNDDLGLFDWVVATAPVEQSLALLPGSFTHRKALGNIKMKGCYALLVGLQDDIDRNFDAALVRDADISWVAFNATKPERNLAVTLVVHASNAWADAHMDSSLSDVQAHMLSQLRSITGWALSEPAFVKVHRWRYANIDSQSGPQSYIDPAQKLAACGDWCIRGRIESAFLSAHSLASDMRNIIRS